MHVDSEIHERQNIMHIQFEMLLILIEQLEGTFDKFAVASFNPSGVYCFK